MVRKTNRVVQSNHVCDQRAETGVVLDRKYIGQLLRCLDPDIMQQNEQKGFCSTQGSVEVPVLSLHVTPHAGYPMGSAVWGPAVLVVLMGQNNNKPFKDANPGLSANETEHHINSFGSLRFILCRERCL